MANKRVILSSIWEDEFVGSLSFMGRCLWIGLFSRCADDQGRLTDNPVVIRSQVFPYDDMPAAEIEAMLATYQQAGKIVRYAVDGRRYIQLVKWWESQQPQWAMPSKYPAPPGWQDKVRSNIKGVYCIQNWPTKAPKVDSPASPPPGDATLPDQVAGHDPDPDPDPDPVQTKTGAKAPGRAARVPHPLSSTPEIQLFRDITKSYPEKENYETVLAAIQGRTREQIEPYFQRWLTVSKNRGSLVWLLDWMTSGKPPGEFGAGAKRNGAHEQPTREQDHAAIAEVFRRRDNVKS